jgi:hypothetical protein
LCNGLDEKPEPRQGSLTTAPAGGRQPPYALDVPYVDPPRPPEYPPAGKRRVRLRPGHALWNALLATVAVGGVVVVSLENLFHLPDAVRWGIVAIVVGSTFIVSLVGLDD